jgi:hypothetical protein
MPNFISEEELDKNFTQIEQAAQPAGIGPEPNQNPYFRGTISPVLQHDANLVATQYKQSSGIPVRPLMPPNPGSGAQGNAGSTGIAAKLISPVQVQANQNTAAIAKLQRVTFQGAWSATTSYASGAQVDFGGIIYVSLQDGNLNNQPDISPTFWQSAGTSTFEGTWNSATAYVDGNSVVYTDPTTGVTAFYIAIAPSTNQPPSTSPTFWQVTGSSSTYVFLGAYSGATTYFPGNQVTDNGQYWICISTTTGNEPNQASSFWELVGTDAQNLAGLDGVQPSQTGQNLVYNGDFSIATVPTGIQSATASAIRVQDIQNGGGIQPSANGWTRNFENGGNGEGVIYQFVTPPSQGLVGPFSLVLQDRTGSTGDVFAAVCDAFAVRQNTLYNFSANLNVGFGTGLPTHAEWFFRVLWYKVGATDFSRSSTDLISFADIVAGSTASGQQAPSGTLTAPANAGYCRIAFYHWFDGTLPASVWNLLVSNVRCVNTLDDITDGTSRYGATGNTLSYRPTSNPLTATDAGSNATISIAAFTMRTGSKGDISYSSGSITALAYSTLYYVYFDDAALAGGAATYNATTTKSTANNGAGRFFLGSIFTPNHGGVATVGYNDGGTGATSGKSLIGGPGSQVVTTSGASVPTFSTFGSSMSGDQSLFDTLTSTGTSNTKSLTYVLSNFGFSNQNYTALSLNVKSALPTNGLNGTGAKWVITYSLNGGITFNALRSTSAGSTYAVTTDTVNLDLRQNLAAVQVKYVMQLATSDTLGTITANIYTPQILGND